jgi:hypothetical protein
MNESFKFSSKIKHNESELISHGSFYIQALENLCGGPYFTILGDDEYENIQWQIDNPPSKEEVAAEYERLNNEWENTFYKRQRSNEYPSITSQLDMLWNSMHIGEIPKSEDFYNSILEIKNKYPKG